MGILKDAYKPGEPLTNYNHKYGFGSVEHTGGSAALTSIPGHNVQKAEPAQTNEPVIT